MFDKKNCHFIGRERAQLSPKLVTELQSIIQVGDNYFTNVEHTDHLNDHMCY